MFRDRSSLVNVGYGITSRDIPNANKEETKPNPNSGLLSKALDDKPILKFVAATTISLVGTYAASKMFSKGGIKLLDTIQRSADSGSRLGRKFVETASQIKKTLDELEGLNRFVADGIDPYERLINRSADGKIIKPTLTKLTGDTYVSDGARWMSSSEYRSLNAGREPVAVWDYRDEIQQRLARTARTLPLTLPTAYFVQKAFTDPLLGQPDEKDKVKWYNPVDVITDFVKRSTINITTMMLPQGLAGAATQRIKSLVDYQYLDYDFPLTPKQRRAGQSFADIKTVLRSFGQDSEYLLAQASRISSSAGYAFGTAVQEKEMRAGGGLVHALRQARVGASAARTASVAAGETRLKRSAKVASAYIFGNSDTETLGALDGIPSIRGLVVGGRAFTKNFFSAKRAYDVVHGTMTYDDALRAGSSDPVEAARVLNSTISDIRKQHRSRIAQFVQGALRSRDIPNLEGANEPDSRGSFSFAFESNEYASMVQEKLVELGADPASAKNMVSGLKISGLNTSKNISQRVTFGISRINSTSDNDEDFFRILVNRANKELKNRGRALDVNQVKQAFGTVDAVFQDEVFRRTLVQRASLAYENVRRNIIVPAASALVKPQKALYSDFAESTNPTKIDYLARSVAQRLGIKLINSLGSDFIGGVGSLVDSVTVSSELAKRGIDSSNVEQLRSFLIDQKMMTRPSDVGGFNLFGLKQVTVDHAFDRGVFSSLSPSESVEARSLFGEIAMQDPVSRAIGFSTVRGVYESASGNIIDTTPITVASQRTLKKISQDFGVPFVKFNPLQMIGLGGPRRTDPFQEIQFLPGVSRQDFLAGDGENAQVFAWVKQKGGMFGSVGKLFSVREGFEEDAIKQIPGLFKPISSIDTDIYARATRLATGRRSYRDSELIAEATGEEISRGERVRSAFDIDEEQPNSITRRIGRFLGRKTDIRNESTLARLIDNGEIRLRAGKAIIFDRNDEGLPQVVDETGAVVFGPDETAEAFENLRISSQGKATDIRSMAGIEEALGIADDLRVSGSSGNDLIDVGRRVLAQFETSKSTLRARDIDITGLSRAARALDRMIEESAATSTYITTTKNTTITTRQDFLRNMIHKFNVEMAAYGDDFGGNPVEIANKIEEVLKNLRESGQISAAQLTEARAAALGTILELSAYNNYSSSLQRGRIASKSLGFLIGEKESNPIFANTLKSFLSPFSTQSISNIDAHGAGRIANLIRPTIKRNLGFAPYELGPNAVNPLGNIGTTFVPTFGTVLDRIGSGQTTAGRVTKSVLGFSSYRDTDSYSSASIPSIHLSERLNRYFETVGLGLQHEEYGGPIGAFFGGYGLKRVLPLAAGAATLMTVDRTIGGMVNEKDQRGERVYSPFFTTKIARGAVEAQSAFSGITPGGMSYTEKREQLLRGEVPVKQGRYWPLGVTPFEGGKTMYYRPSYYRRLASGSTYTSDAFGSPLERFAYGYDFSPLRPFDPYRFEREHYFDRPYPVTGEYFSGSFGPITPLLNMTVGKVLKPQVKMHDQEVKQSLSQYIPAGNAGAYNPSGLVSSGRVAPVMGASVSGASDPQYFGSSNVVGLQIGNYNNQISLNVEPLNTARNISFNTIGSANANYVNASRAGFQRGQQQMVGAQMLYGPPPVPGYIPPNIVSAAPPISQGSIRFQKSELGYRTQEMAGLYGFGFANLRQSFGFGSSDFEPTAPVLQSASKAYGIGRSFWDLNLGGLGDVPSESGMELSEITRRFIPKERTNINYLNPIANTMGMKYPFLPGSDYFINFKTGDPFTKVQEGELRLPGVTFERLNPTKRDYTDPVTQLDILADVAPYSREFRSLDRTLNMGGLDPSQRVEVERIRAQVSETTKRNTFRPYKYKGKTAEELGTSEPIASVLRMGEYLAHRDTFINTKFFPNRTAQEDWERRNVYGSTFPEWQRPIESFIKPIYDKSTQRNPVASGLIMAAVGSMFGKTAPTKALGATIGLSTGIAYSTIQNTKQLITGERFIPKERKKQLALEEYVDILSYVKNRSLSTQAAESGDMQAAAQFSQAAKRTMYGADIYGGSVDTLSLSIPKRKREHFKAMIEEQDPEERKRILSTAPRLERRIYEAAWGMQVEKKPDLIEYFSRHELPDMGWEGWHPNTNMEHVKVKIGQSMGINLSQMGYYPQQIREANLTNPSYPGLSRTEDPRMVAARLRMIMSRNGISGSVYPVANGTGSSSINISSGVM
jgi:hypothetical protein